MKTRMEKYYDSTSNETSRTKKNTELYSRVTEGEMENFDVNSNMAVLGDANSIDVDKVREMLDRKYRVSTRKKPISIDDVTEIPKVDIDETREYDINTIIEKAKETKEVNYEIDRLKKLRNTQYDILKNLKIDNDEYEEVTPEEKTLINLINTITEKELSADKEMDPLDLFTDLRGDDDTVVVSGFQNDKDSIKKEITAEIKDEILKEVKQEVGAASNFTQSDFDDFNDLKEDVESTKIIIKVIVVIIAIAFAAGVLFLLNKFLELGLF